MRAAVARNLEGRGVNVHPRTTLTEVGLLISSFMIIYFFSVSYHAASSQLIV